MMRNEVTVTDERNTAEEGVHDAGARLRQTRASCRRRCRQRGRSRRVEGLDQFGDLLRRVLQVVVHRHDILPAPWRKPHIRALCATVIAHQLDGDDAPVLLAQLAKGLPGVVGTAVIDEDGLGDPRRAPSRTRQRRRVNSARVRPSGKRE